MTAAQEKVASPRGAGILLHPTSLAGPYGIGDLGPAAYAWIDALVRAKQQWWQILPLGPTSYGDSPYQSLSAFAGNPNLISPELVHQDGLLSREELGGETFPADRVDYSRVSTFKNGLWRLAWERFQAGKGQELQPAFEAFNHEQAAWLDDFALFLSLKDRQGGKSWQDWPADVRLRDAAALERARVELAASIGLHKFRQFLFSRQWQKVKAYAGAKGIRIIGDIPIFVAGDSADVWANPHFFLLDEQNRPRVVAGVPPDYFSATGQLWGNPLYDWEAMRASGYAWWVARMRATLQMVDLIRLDHFRGFEAYWEIPAGQPTAEVGRWVKGPGASLLETLRAVLGNLPLIAEDLGVITPEMEALRDQFELPGMRVLHFAFDDPENPYLPHNFVRRTVVYTGTHDNDTTRGWYRTAAEKEKDFVRRYLGRDAKDIAWDLIRLAWASVADLAIVPLQDLFDLGTEARMNYPGKPVGNWGWRFTANLLRAEILDRLADLTEVYGRALSPKR